MSKAQDGFFFFFTVLTFCKLCSVYSAADDRHGSHLTFLLISISFVFIYISTCDVCLCKYIYVCVCMYL